MSSPRDIDNDEVLFQFDPFDSRQSFSLSNSPQPLSLETAGTSAQTMSSQDRSPTTEEVGGNNGSPTRAAIGKGKAKTMPMPIRPSMIVHDLFDMSPPSLPSLVTYGTIESSSSSSTFSPSTTAFSSDYDSVYHGDSFATDSMESPVDPLDTEMTFSNPYTGKGKQKETYPMLPPLTFPDMDLDYNLPPTPGPSSYGTLYSPPPTNQSLAPSSAISTREIPTPPPSPTHSSESGPSVSNAPVARCRSLTNLSHQLSTPSIGSVSTAISAPYTFGPSNAPSNISRQLLNILDKKEKNRSVDAFIPVVAAVDPNVFLSTPDLQTIQREPAWYTASQPSGSGRVPSPRAIFKGKSRSQSSPYPISALDFIPVTSTDVFEPLPIVIVNYFDLILPKELRLHILRALVDVHEHDYQRLVSDGRLSMAKATSSRSRWVGRDKGIRELFKLSRVSKAWQTLVFDGQLWADLDLQSFPGLPQDVIERIIRSAGSFIRSLNIAGHNQLSPETMTNLTRDLCLAIPDTPLPYTQLTSINLQGCTSLTTRALHHLLVRSTSLRTLSVKGLGAVTNTTCDIIANFCSGLTALNMSRCHNMDAEGVRALAFAANLRGEHLKLKELRLSGLKYVTDITMRELGRASPFLEVLDLSYTRQLHNSAVEAFAACHPYLDSHLGVDTVVVSARDLGRETSDPLGKLKRRVTRLRHLNLSHCIMLTDDACSNLAYSVPKLEFLELAGIGPALKDGGLVRLLQQTPHIRRVDLEDASDITDAVIRTITPAVDVTASPSSAVRGQPGHALQHLNISYAGNVSDDALLGLVRNCQHLTALEADNTRMGKTVLKEFIKLSRERKAPNARIVAIDCRGIGESLVKEVSSSTRPRLGWRRYDARKLGYLDARDDNDDELKIGQDECDEQRVVIKTFYSWQTVDAVKVAREKRRKAMGSTRRTGSDSSNGTSDFEVGSTNGRPRRGSMRWWSPGGRRIVGRNGDGVVSASTSPILPDVNGSEGCRMM